MRRSTLARIGLVASVLVLVGAFYRLGLQNWLSLAQLKAHHTQFMDLYQANPFLVLGVYFGTYVLVAALSIPGATVLTLAAGALFGLPAGLLVVSFASSLGALLAFLGARFLLRESVERRLGERLKAIQGGIQRDGAFYLFTMRLVPIFPFFVVNLVMGLTPIRPWTFYWVSQLGMIPGTAVYVNAGTQLAQLDSLRGILSPTLLGSFALLGVFPWIARRALAAFDRKRRLSRYPRPRSIDYNVVVIGAGAGGLVSAYIAAAVRARVALIEANKMGGDCLNTGCVPSKALLRSARWAAEARKAQEFGFKPVDVACDFGRVMGRIRTVIDAIEPHDSVERYSKLGVDCIAGKAKVVSPFKVAVGPREITTRNIIIATGGGPIIPDIPGLSTVPYVTSDSVWNLTELPRKLLVLGGGAIGCELGQALARLGSSVTLVERGPRLLAREDLDAAQAVAEQLQSEGIQVLVNCEVQSFATDSEGRGMAKLAAANGKDKQAPKSVVFDKVLLALGRQGHGRGLGLEELGIEIRPNGTIAHDSLLRTSVPNIYCVGDVSGTLQLTHYAAHEAWYAAVNALFGSIRTYSVDRTVIPRITFTDPEVATVGHTIDSARAASLDFEVARYGLDDLDRAICDSAAHGWIQVLTVRGRDKILGATVVGPHAGEILGEIVLAMRHGLGLNKILSTVHAYPSYAEANKFVAGVWRKSHAPGAVLTWLERYHRWMR